MRFSVSKFTKKTHRPLITVWLLNFVHYKDKLPMLLIAKRPKSHFENFIAWVL